MASIEQSGEVPGVNVTGSQGMQIGSGNTQYNAWGPKPQLDPAALSGLNPHTAVDRLLKLTHDELVDFFACAKPEDMSEILEIFLFNERLKLIAVLGDISRRKAAGLIAAIDASEALRVLPDAAYEISRKAASLRFTNGGALQPVQLPRGVVEPAYFRKYDNGRVWSSRFGTYETVGPVDRYCIAAATKFNLGVPVSDLKSAPRSPFGTHGLYQKFSRGTVYSSEIGVFCVTSFSGVDECYHDQGGTGEWLGFPVEDRPTRPAPSMVQNFEGGAIYSYSLVGSDAPQQCAFAVRRSIISSLPEEGWRPVSKEALTASSSGTQGTIQAIEFKYDDFFRETAVYSSTAYGAVPVAQEIWGYYKDLGAEKSWLGFPTHPQFSLSPLGAVEVQDFEAGRIYWQPDIESLAVRTEVVKLIERYHFLGYPESGELPVGTGGVASIQFFGDSVVTCVGGSYRVWRLALPDT